MLCNNLCILLFLPKFYGTRVEKYLVLKVGKKVTFGLEKLN